MKTAPWAVAALASLVLPAGCGLAANPQPPTLWLPNPVKDLKAERTGNRVRLHWTMPGDTTDKVTLKGPQHAHICWNMVGLAVRAQTSPAAKADPCHGAGDANYAPRKPADFTTDLPSDLLTGSPRAIRYFVELENHAGKSAGPSNSALVATGTAPPAVTGLRLETRADGVLLHWDPRAPEANLVLRIHRTLVAQAGAPKANPSSGVPPSQQQTLEVNLDRSDAGEALDRDAALNRVWRYTAERVLGVQADKHVLEIAGMPSEAVTIDAKNVFPPPVPVGLAAVPDEQARAIDLSWTPDTDPRLAGYVIYRRDLTADTPQGRISGKSPVVPPAFEDRNVQPGHRYAYSVSAVDQDGNESARCAEIEEELPQ